MIVVAENERKAKVKGLKQILEWNTHHKDYVGDIEKIISIDALLASQNLFIYLEEKPAVKPFNFTCKYIPLGKKEKRKGRVLSVS